MAQQFENAKDEVLYNHNHDEIDRRGFLKCMAWAGTGALWVLKGGVLSSYSLKIDNFSFTPQTLTVAAGTTVTWTNNDDVPHNVISTGKIFKSKTMDTGEKFSYTFIQPGTYDYYCSIHPRMTSSVIVK